MARNSKLTRGIRSLQSSTEQPAYRRKVKKATQIARAAPASKGTISNRERLAIRKATRAVKIVTTSGEAQGVRRQLRRKARRS